MTSLAPRHAAAAPDPEGGAACPIGPRAGAHAAYPMSLDPLLLNLLACPIDKRALLYLADHEVLYNPRLRRSYQVRDGIPVMLADQGQTVTDETHHTLLRAAASGGEQRAARVRRGEHAG